MGIRSSVVRAAKIVDSYGGEHHQRLKSICAGIQAAETDLVRHAQGLFAECQGRCRGMCCRNIEIGNIISALDFVYIFTMDQTVRGPVWVMSQQQNLFTADCIFLKEGTGPCLFKASIKPEMCIATFCGDVQPIKGHLKTLRAEFGRLQRFVMRQRPWLWFT
jgi:hypothetical protein